MTDRMIWKIAEEIVEDWEKPNFAAVPYLRAMHSLMHISDPYGFDSGDSIIRYFLANAGTWRGETARRVKKELRAMLK